MARAASYGRMAMAMATGMAVLGMVTSACEGPRYTWKQKLMVEVETPDGVKVGSSVQEVSVWIQGWVPREVGRSVSSSIRGEAVAVEVSTGRILFVLLDSDVPQRLAQNTLSNEIGLYNSTFEVWAIADCRSS